jgi:hypothetical protein
MFHAPIETSLCELASIVTTESVRKFAQNYRFVSQNCWQNSILTCPSMVCNHSDKHRIFRSRIVFVCSTTLFFLIAFVHPAPCKSLCVSIFLFSISGSSCEQLHSIHRCLARVGKMGRWLENRLQWFPMMSSGNSTSSNSINHTLKQLYLD